VRSLRTWLVAVLAVLWGPLTVHCAIEAVPGLEFVRCSDAVAAAGHDSDPCDESVCCELESVVYHPPRQETMVVRFSNELPSATVFHAVQSPAIPVLTFSVLLNASPPDLPVAWRFTQRAALPVRAPTVYSLL